jgi:hypothetical protein
MPKSGFLKSWRVIGFSGCFQGPDHCFRAHKRETERLKIRFMNFREARKNLV